MNDLIEIISRLRNLNPWQELDWPDVVHAAAADLEAVKRERDEHAGLAQHHFRARLEAASALSRMKGALEPFATRADRYNGVPGILRISDCVELWQIQQNKGLQIDITVGDLRRAREAYEALSIPAERGEAGVTEAERFDRADWYWRVMDPDDSGDTPEQAIHRSMHGDLVVCEIASSFRGPTRFGFTAPVLDPDSDDTEFLHFATEQEALEAAKERAAALKAALLPDAEGGR